MSTPRDAINSAEFRVASARAAALALGAVYEGMLLFLLLHAFDRQTVHLTARACEAAVRLLLDGLLLDGLRP